MLNYYHLINQYRYIYKINVTYYNLDSFVTVTCSNFTEQKECCNQTTLGCVYVNCTGTDKKAYNG